MEGAGLSDVPLKQVRCQVVRLVDFVIDNQLSSPRLSQAIEAILKLGIPETEQSLTTWNACLAGTINSHVVQNLILNHYTDWVLLVRPDLRSVFYESIPRVARCVEHRLQLG
jgi:hypothetical protein